jgi:VIT1/CCC1 family predicted Fe2+/Mn2+ transporter
MKIRPYYSEGSYDERMFTRRNHRSRADLRAEHTPEAIAARLEDGSTDNYLRDAVYGAIDGAVTTFAVIAGVFGANLDVAIVLILGVGNLLADGFSMAVSNFLGTRAEQQRHEQARREEEAHVREIPEGEREEVRQIFARRGLSGDALDQVVDAITSDPKQWVDIMMREELGLAVTGTSALKAAAYTFAAFVVVGSLPLLAYIYEAAFGGLAEPFVWSAVMTGAAFFLVGAVKGRYVGESWIRSAVETLAVGSLAALIAFMAGVLLKGLAG